MEKYILNLSDAEYATLKKRWLKNWDIDIDAEYGSREQFAAEMENDVCWLDWHEFTGLSPSDYLSL